MIEIEILPDEHGRLVISMIEKHEKLDHTIVLKPGSKATLYTYSRKKLATIKYLTKDQSNADNDVSKPN